MYFKGRELVVVGGTGSIGKALVKSILREKPSKINVISNDENSLFETREEIDSSLVEYFLCDVRERKRLKTIFEIFDLNVLVFNCSAVKHVKIAEENPLEAVKTNIIGLSNVLAAARYSLGLIQISTDKAIEPTSVMGASKLICERMVLNAYRRFGFRAAIVRFGNVYGSRGSLVPIVKKKLETFDPIPITDRGMKRYFIKIKDAAEFIKNCSKNFTGGEIFVPKMEEYAITDVIDQIISESGVPPSLVQFKEIGIRNGEKLREKLFSEKEKRNLVKIKGGYKIK